MDPTDRARRRRHELWLFATTCLIESVILGALAASRNVNPDEGFYAVAGWHLLEGKHLYRDFFYPQMPYLPYAEAAVLAFTGPSLLALRWISVASGAVVGGLVAAAAARRTDSLAAGAVIAVAYAAHSLCLNYLSIIKTYGLANLGLVVSFLVLALMNQRRRSVALLAGLAAGLAVGARLPAAAAVVVLALWSLRRGAHFAVVFVAGVGLASLPWLASVLESPEQFWFSNFGFHALRREIVGFVPIIGQKLLVALKWVALPQNAVLWIGAAAGVVAAPAWSVPAFACAAALGVAYLAATPTYLDYMVQVIPFLLLAAAPVIPRLLSRRSLLAAVLVLYATGLVLARRDAPEESARGVKAKRWNLAAVNEVAAYLHANSAPGDPILSWWEGYPFLAARHGYIGVGFWESNASRKLSADERRRYHILHQQDLHALLRLGHPRLVVVPRGIWESLQPVLDQRYELARDFDGVRVYARRGDVA